MRWVKRILIGLLGLVVIVILAMVGVVVALNSAGGRAFAVREINKYGAAYIQIGQLRGHFPADINITSFAVKDPKGIWFSGRDVTLKWSPLQLLRRNLAVRLLSAQSLDVARAPAYPASKRKNSGNSQLPSLRLNLDRLEIAALHVAPSLAGEDVTLHVTGQTHLRDLQHGDIALNATTESGDADYALTGTLDPRNVAMKLHVQEPPNGLIGHFAGPQVRLPLKFDVMLNGPRAHAALQAALALGDARLNVTGTLGLDQTSPFADVVLSVPALAPFGTLARQPISGQTQLHLVVEPTAKQDGATLALQGDVALNQSPAGLDKFLNGETHLSLLASLQGHKVTIGQLLLDAPHAQINGHGVLDKQQLDLTTDAKLNDLATLLPRLQGALQLHSHVTGTMQDFATKTAIDGQVSVPNVPSGPFQLTLTAQHLPKAPQGTLTGSGTLAGSPLNIDARFTRQQDGAASLNIATLDWKSLAAQADLALAAGAKLPTGSAHLALGHLADFDAFTGMKLHGALQADFVDQGQQNLSLQATAKNISGVPSIGAANATLEAQGTLQALAVKLDASVARLMGAAAKLALTGTLNIPAQSAHLASLTGNWHGLNAKLNGPADIEAKPEMAVRHLDLSVGKAAIALDGTLSPTLNAKASVKNLDLALAKLFVPSVNAAGIVNLTANVTGTPKAPAGQVALTATGLRYIDKSTAGLPAASISGTATLKGDSADVNIKAQAGADAAITARGTAPLSMTGPMKLALNAKLDLAMLNPALAKMHTKLSGTLSTSAQLSGTPKAPAGQVSLTGRNLRDEAGPAAALPAASLDAKANLQGQRAALDVAVKAGPDVNLTARGSAPFTSTGAINLAVAGRLDLKLLDPILAANGNLVRGRIDTNLRISGTAKAPRANGTLQLADGSVQNIASGLNLTAITASVNAADKLITLQSLSATAGQGKITGHGSINLGAPNLPVDIALNADHATPISSDLVNETLNAALRLQGDLKGNATLGGTVDILKANINLPKSLPPSVANLPIHNGSAPPPKPSSAAPPAPPIRLALDVRARNQIFIRGDGLFAELGGNIHIGGTADNPQPSGGFKLIRGTFSLTGTTLQFTSGKIDFNGAGFIPVLDLEATTPTSTNGTATLVIGGTAAKPKITLTSSPPMPSDEILSQILFKQSASSLSPFQAASLAVALAQLTGVGGGFSPVDSVRNALGLDQLSVGSDSAGNPAVQAGRYVAPGVYVGASQATSGGGTSAKVQINLYKGLKLQTTTGQDSTGNNGSSVGLTYQFNY
ncbi:translocation/assembly module TamB domain-containing protein [Acidocella facilis]|uniref:translocation/assembly module TamB domain-containing protein n=1 Tax=Acidocella facilis TaxID=525 RepID=UPI00047C3F3A|nr:translocation/assembly module TamB domain-containing protein [Acidocella facilis]